MSAILRKTLSPQTFCRLRLILSPSSKILNLNRLTSTPKNLVRSTAYFANVAHQHEKDNLDPKVKIETDVDVHVKLDRMLTEIDSIIRRSGRIGKRKVQLVLSTLEDIGSVTETHGLYLLRSCRHVRSEPPASRVELANHVWKKLHNLGCQFTVDHFNSLLKLYLECNLNFSPTEFLARMEGANVEPNSKTFTFLIEQYCNQGDLAGAGEILQFLKEKNLPLTESMFNALVKGHFRANDIEGARKILEVMQSSKLSPTAKTYTTLACEYARVGNVENMESVLAEAKKKVQLNNNNYLSIIISLSEELPIEVYEKFISMLENIEEWKQDFFNSMYDLLHKDCDDAAFKLLIIVNGPQENYYTNLFLRQLIKGKRPIESILQWCEHINNEFADNFIYLHVLKISMELEYFDLALSLFDVMQSKGFPVRMHYFKPLLQHYKSMKSEEGVLLILKKMYLLGIPLDYPMFSEYVFPTLSSTEPELVMAKIGGTGQSPLVAVGPLFQYYCRQGDFKSALYLVENYSFQVPFSFDFERFMSFSRNFQGEEVYLKVLSFLVKNIGSFPSEEAETKGRILSELLLSDRALFKALHRTTFHRDFKYSKQTLNVAWNILQVKNPNLLPVLQNLREAPSNSIPSATKQSAEAEETSDPLNLLSYYIKDRNIVMVNSLIEKLTSTKNTLPPYIYVQLLNMHCQTDNLEAANETYNILKEIFPSMKINSAHIVNYVSLLMKFSKFEEAKEIMRNEFKELNVVGSHAIFMKKLKHLFRTAIQFGDIQLIEDFRASLIPHSDALQSKIIIHEPMVKFHLFAKDLESALREFRKCVSEQQVAPCIVLLLKECIANDNPAQVKEVIDVASPLLGHNVVLHKLFQALVEMQRFKQAQEVLSNLDNKVDEELLYNACMHFYESKQVSILEEFLSLIVNLSHINKDRLYFYLFKLYAENNDATRAYVLYNNIVQTKKIEVGDKTKELLANLFRQNNKPSPFDKTKQDDSVPMNTTAANDKGVQEFLEAVNQDNAVLSLEKLHPLKKGFVQSLPFSVVSQFLDLLVHNKCVFDLTQNDQIMSYIINNPKGILEPLLEKYSKTGNIESLNQLAGFLPDFTLKHLSFSSFLSKSYIVANRTEELLEKLEYQWDMKNKLFSLQAFDAFLRNPALEQRAISLAEKYLKIEFDLPIAVVWAHYLINGNPERAEEIFKSYSIPVGKVDSLVLKRALQQGDVNLARKYVDLANEQNLKIRVRERAYKTLIDILVSKEMHQQAEALVNEAKEKDIDINLHYKLALKDANKELK